MCLQSSSLPPSRAFPPLLGKCAMRGFIVQHRRGVLNYLDSFTSFRTTPSLNKLAWKCNGGQTFGIFGGSRFFAVWCIFFRHCRRIMIAFDLLKPHVDSNAVLPEDFCFCHSHKLLNCWSEPLFMLSENSPPFWKTTVPFSVLGWKYLADYRGYSFRTELVYTDFIERSWYKDRSENRYKWTRHKQSLKSWGCSSKRSSNTIFKNRVKRLRNYFSLW